MKIDYKKELEQASRTMIMIHDPRLLIRLIIRMIVRKLGIKHAAMILYEPDINTYVLSISRGERGVKIPKGYTRFDHNSPIIKLFTDERYRPIIRERGAIVAHDLNKLIWQEGVIKNGNGTKELLQRVEEQMEMLNSVASVPAFYQDQLMAVLLLGEKYDGSAYDQEELDFFSALASDAAMAIRNAQLFIGLKKEAKRNRELFIQTIIVLGSTIEAKDSYTHGHTERVTNYALAIARQMRANGTLTFGEEFLENLYIAGLLHDMGKIAIPEGILNKKGGLSPEEYEVMKTHTLRGSMILKPLNLPKDIIDGIKYHHERFDGQGYPEGLKGDDIPISASILAVADAYDAMTTNRPYRKSLSREEAMKEIDRGTGAQFNPIPARAFMELMESGKI